MSTQLIGWAQIKQHKDKRFKSRNHSFNLLIQFTKHIYTSESVFLFILGLPDLPWTNLVTMVQRPSTLMIQIKGGTIRQKAGTIRQKAALWQVEIGRIRTAGERGKRGQTVFT